MEKQKQNSKINIDGEDYLLSDLSDEAKLQIANIRFSEERIIQLQNELTISRVARNGYLIALNGEVAKPQKGLDQNG